MLCIIRCPTGTPSSSSFLKRSKDLTLNSDFTELIHGISSCHIWSPPPSEVLIDFFYTVHSSHQCVTSTHCQLTVMFCLDFTYYAETSDCSLSPFPLFPHRSLCTIPIWSETHVRYNLPVCNLYNITSLLSHCTISISEPQILRCSVQGGVTIPIGFVSSTTDSIRQCVVLFKPVTVLDSDPKSEFLCQSSLCRRTYRPP